MKTDKLLKNIFTSDILFNDSISYRRVIVINSILVFAMFAFFTFIFINTFIIQNNFIAALDIFSFLTALITFLELRRTKNIPRAAFISSSLLIFFMAVFILINNNTHLGIIWTLFPAFVSMIANGKKVGLYFILFFYSFMFYLAYMKIGIWNEGLWNIVDFLRYVFSVTLITGISYMAESSYDMSDKALIEVRENEAKVLEKLKNQAITDTLTGMYNRRYFNETIPKILKTAQRDKKYISFFILDIDYFKNYNDLYGHQAGDEALKKVGDALQSFTQRESDLVFRIGGRGVCGNCSCQYS